MDSVQEFQSCRRGCVDYCILEANSRLLASLAKSRRVAHLVELRRSVELEKNFNDFKQGKKFFVNNLPPLKQLDDRCSRYSRLLPRHLLFVIYLPRRFIDHWPGAAYKLLNAAGR